MEKEYDSDSSELSDSPIKYKSYQENTRVSEKYLSKNFFTFNELEHLSEDNIYDIFSKSHLIIFVNNFRLQAKKNIFCYLSTPISNFKEITFLPYEFKYQLDDMLRNLNKRLSSMKKIISEDKFKIIFDEGLIQKGILYRRLIVQNSYVYIPINKYQMKITEYKIRGFCQIMEELGASKIEIDFQKDKKKQSRTDSELDAKMIAGNLGFSLNSINEINNKSIYSLVYPGYNNVILNIQEIENKIKNGDYLISLEDYNTNLELQYIINSRCRHYITTYSTTFTLKNVNDFDTKILFKLGIPEIKNNISINNYNSSSLLISTNVKFDDSYRSPSQLLSISVPTTEIGFNFILNNIKKKYNEVLPEEWLVFIWRFTNNYIEKKFNLHLAKKNIQNDNDSSEDYNQYYEIKQILNLIRENFSLKEIINLLKNYFNINSQMNNFTNFIKLLANKTKSYDSLGLFILLASNKNESILIKINKLKQFLNSIERDNAKLKEMLLLYDDNSNYNFYKKINSYGILVLGNWFGIEKLLKDISKYELFVDCNHLDLNNNDEREKYCAVIFSNYNLGYKDYIFIKYILPFMENQLYYYYYAEKFDLDLEIIRWIINNLYRESIDFRMVSSYGKLESYLESRIIKAKQIIKIKKDCIKKNTNKDKIIDDIIDIINNNSFLTKRFIVIFKKYLIGNKLKPKVTEYFFKETEYSLAESIEYFFHRIYCYNYRLKLNSLPLDEHGYMKINRNIIYGITADEIEKLLIPFLRKYQKFYELDFDINLDKLLKINYESDSLSNIIYNLKNT